jgi:aspartate racemase
VKSRLVNLSAEKRQLLGKLLAGTAADPDRILPRERGPLVPASYQQERLWFLDRLNPGIPVYQISAALPLACANREALERGLNALIHRHESLRTRFDVVDGSVVQVIVPAMKLELDEIDLSRYPEDLRTTEARRIGGEDARRPFDISTGPLIRAKLIVLAPGSDLLIVTLHHIIADGWSLDILTRELSILYEAFLNGKPASLPALPIRYSDYVLWQRERLTTERLGPQIEYWRRELDGAAAVKLPLDSSAKPRDSSRGARVFFRFGRDETQALEALSREARATLFMMLLAAFQILLARYSGQDDIVCGSPVAGRNRPEVEGLIGFFLNTICLRTRIDPNEIFFELVGRVRDTALRAYAHQELPFDKLVAELAPRRGAGDDVLFNVMFVLQAAARRFTNGDDTLEWQFESETAKFDITLSILETGNGLAGAIEYRTDLFKRSRIERMAGHFVQLLRSILKSPRARVADLEILSDGERAQFAEWNATAAAYPEDACVHELVSQQAARTPDAIAVRCGNLRMTYAELESRASLIAKDLAARNCAPEEPVGILAERGPHLLPSLLGIWKAGCSWVALDPDAPAERTQSIVEDAGIRVVIRNAAMSATAAFDSVAWSPAAQAAGSRRLAYILYTSGSTGKPKGVMVEHRSLVNYLMWVNRTLLATAPPLIPAIAKVTFDASIKQIFAPLIAGRTVWLIPETVVASLRDLVNELAEANAAFTLNCVPWLWSILLDEIGGKTALRENLKALLLGGEAVSADLVDRTFPQFPHLELWNLYGPTETTANATAQKVRRGDAVSIGRPIANTRAFVLDANGLQTPVGVPGELHIGGDGLARGYLNRPELTNARFIGGAHGTLYKTGDLARYNDDGTLEFLGRLDAQVKLRGYRIEPGDIQAQLARHPKVWDSIVQLDAGNGEPRLVAFIETRGQPVTASDLRVFLRSALPDYMIPAQFVLLDGLPRNPHGKVDPARLGELTDIAREGGEAYIAPRDDYEQRLAEIWGAVLQLEKVGVRTDFFTLGGHSLLVIQAISRIREEFGVEVPIRTFFDSPAIEDLAIAIRNMRERDPLPAPTAIPRLARIARQKTADS